MIGTSVQIKTAKTQKHLYCPVFTYRVLIRDFTYDHSIFLFRYGLMQGAVAMRFHVLRQPLLDRLIS